MDKLEKFLQPQKFVHLIVYNLLLICIQWFIFSHLFYGITKVRFFKGLDYKGPTVLAAVIGVHLFKWARCQNWLKEIRIVASW